MKVRTVKDSGHGEPVFNLRVDQAHTYFVVPLNSRVRVLVHNDSATATAPATQPSPQYSSLFKPLDNSRFPLMLATVQLSDMLLGNQETLRQH